MEDRTQALIEALCDEKTRPDELLGLDDAALATLEDELRAAAADYNGRDEYTAEDLAEVTRIRDAFNVVQEEKAARSEAVAAEEAAAAERAAQAAATLEEMAETPQPEPAPEPVPDPDPETPDEADEVPAEAVKQPAKARRRPSLAELATSKPDQPEPVTVSDVRPRWQARDGERLGTLDDIAERITEAHQSVLEAPPGLAQKIVVASVQADYPSERRFDASDDPADNMVKLDRFLDKARHPETWGEEERAITASGGFCAPAEPRYDVYNISDQARPVRDGLARVGVTRGSITVVPAANLSTVVTTGAAGSAISAWTNATDITPGETTKPRQTFACRTPRTCDVQAVVARARFGNFMNRAFPELIADDVQLIMTAHARVAERALLDCLITAMNMDVAQTGFFGTARDIKDHSMQVAANVRSWERSSTPVRGVVAREILPMVVVDVLNQQASGEVDALMVDEGWARSLMNSTGLLWTYAMDTPTGADAFQFATDGANLPDWPDNFEIPFFPEGSALFLDGGRLDLGIVRDSTLNNTNDYEMFVETFEGCCWLGPYGMTLTLTTCPNGESQAPSDVTTVCSGS